MKSCNCDFKIENLNTLPMDMFRILKKDIESFKKQIEKLKRYNYILKSIVAVETAILLFLMLICGFLFYNVYINADPNNPKITTEPIKKVAVMTAAFKLKKKGSDVMDEECSV